MSEEKHIPNYEQPITGVTWLIPKQCQDCIFRYRGETIFHNQAKYNKDGVTYEDVILDLGEHGWQRDDCQIFPYPECKPDAVMRNIGECECYEKEKQRKK